jgi:hypothetical protein
MKKVLFQLRKERTIPEDAICRNCGAKIMGRYCHECGQDYFAGTGIPIFKLIGQVLDNAFALEGKTPRTLAHLMIRPGFLSDEYMNGKVSRYVHPVKLFWMATLIFFALIIFQSNRSDWQKNVIENIKTGKNINIKGNETEDDIKKQQIIEFISLAPQIALKFAPYVVFLLIPFFAVLLALFFWRKKYYYVHHLIFTVHFHTFLWIFCSLLLILRYFISAKFPGWLSSILFIIPGVYLIAALHHFYHSKKKKIKIWWQTIWKSAIISILYLLILSFISVFLLILFVKIYFPELAS